MNYSSSLCGKALHLCMRSYPLLSTPIKKLSLLYFPSFSMFFRWFSSQPINKLFLPLNNKQKKTSVLLPSLPGMPINNLLSVNSEFILHYLRQKLDLGPLNTFSLPASIILIFISRGHWRATAGVMLLALMCSFHRLLYRHHAAPPKWLPQKSAPPASSSYSRTAAPSVGQISSAPASWDAWQLAAASQFSQLPEVVLQWSASHRTTLGESTEFLRVNFQQVWCMAPQRLSWPSVSPGHADLSVEAGRPSTLGTPPQS